MLQCKVEASRLVSRPNIGFFRLHVACMPSVFNSWRVVSANKAVVVDLRSSACSWTEFSTFPEVISRTKCQRSLVVRIWGRPDLALRTPQAYPEAILFIEDLLIDSMSAISLEESPSVTSRMAFALISISIRFIFSKRTNSNHSGSTNS